MKRPQHPITLHHDDGRSFPVAAVSRMTGTAIVAAVKKQWPAITQHTGESLVFERVPYCVTDPRIVFRSSPWTLIATRTP